MQPLTLSPRAHRALLLVGKALAALGYLGMLAVLAVATLAGRASAQSVPTVADSLVPRVVRVVRVASRVDTVVTTQLVARADTVRDTVRVLPLAVRRFDGGSGAVTVSNGIPLVRGLVRLATLDSLHVVVAGAERAIAVTALSGRFPDGSLRAVRVQFADSLVDAAPVAASLVIGGAYDTLALPRPALVPASPVPVAAALPTDPHYLVATHWGGELTVAGSDTGTLVRQFESDYTRLEAADWTRCGAGWGCSRTAGYDRGFILYQAWLRTGTAAYWYHAAATEDDYLTKYIAPNGGPTPWWSESEGVAVHYWATGDERSRYLLRKIAESMAAQTRPGYGSWIGGTRGDDRMRAKALMAAIDCAALDISTQPTDALRYYRLPSGNAWYVQWLNAGTLARDVDLILATQRTNGQFGGTYYSAGTWSADSGGQSNYMVGMLLTTLIRYYDEVTPDPRIPVAVQRAVDDLWRREWVAPAQAFDYHSTRGTNEGGTTRANSSPQPGLNTFMLHPFAWVARVTGDPAYVMQAAAQLKGLALPVSRNWWKSSGKAFDEAYAHLFTAFALGAH